MRSGNDETTTCTLLFDGECPLCRKEVAWLEYWNRRGRLAFEDVSSPEFDPARYGLTRNDVMTVIHAVLPDGRIVRRMEAFRHAYRAVGLGWLLAPTGWWPLRILFDWLYERFAKNRLRIGWLFGRRCDGDRCGVTKSLLPIVLALLVAASAERPAIASSDDEPLDAATQATLSEFVRLQRGFRGYDFLGVDQSWQSRAWSGRAAGERLSESVVQFAKALEHPEAVSAFQPTLALEDRRRMLAIGLGGLLVRANRDPELLAQVRTVLGENTAPIAALLQAEASASIRSAREAAIARAKMGEDPSEVTDWDASEDARGRLEALLCGAALLGRDVSLMPLLREAKAAAIGDLSTLDVERSVRDAFFPALVMADADSCWTALAELLGSVPADSRPWLTQSLRGSRGGNRRLLESIARATEAPDAFDGWNCLARQIVIEFRKNGSRSELSLFNKAFQLPRSDPASPEHQTNRRVTASALFGLFDLAEPTLARELIPVLASMLGRDAPTMGPTPQHMSVLSCFPRALDEANSDRPVMAQSLRQPLLTAATARVDWNYATLKLVGAYGCYANNEDILVYVRRELTRSPMAAPTLAAILGTDALAEIDAIDPATCELVGVWKEAATSEQEFGRNRDESRARLETEEAALMEKLAVLDPGVDLAVEKTRGEELDRVQRGLADIETLHSFAMPVARVRLDFVGVRDDARRIAGIVTRLRSHDPAVVRSGLDLAAAHRLEQRHLPELNFGQWYVPDMLEAYRLAPSRFGDRAQEMRAAILTVAARYGTLPLRELIEAERAMVSALPESDPIRTAFEREPLASLPPLYDIW